MEEIEQTGRSTASDYIAGKVRAGNCACEIKNPSGRCCLAEVNRTIKEGMGQIGQASGIKLD